MKILMVSNYFSNHGGGIELVAGNIIERLAASGHQVTWAAFESGLPSKSAAQILPLSGSNIIERRTGIPYPFLSPASIRKLRQAVNRAEIVHVHDCIYKSSRVAARHALRLRKPVVLTQHIGELPFRGFVHRIMASAANRLLTVPLLNRATRVVFISENVRRYYEECFDSKRQPRMIFNGVDTRIFNTTSTRFAERRALDLPPDARIALFVGRFVEKKGLDRIQALARRFPEVTWLMIGRGPIDPKTWRLANVRTIGPVTQREIPKWLRAADIFTLLSVGEGFPLVIQEALTCGCPVFTSEEIVGACPVIEGRVAHTARDFSNMESTFAEVLATLPDSEEQRAARSRYFSSHWDWDSCTQHYAALYRELLSTEKSS